jgi:hypothetical protein
MAQKTIPSTTDEGDNSNSKGQVAIIETTTTEQMNCQREQDQSLDYLK